MEADKAERQDAVAGQVDRGVRPRRNRSEMMCECYMIGGPFIAEDPYCPVHGREAQKREHARESAVDAALTALRKARQIVDATASPQHAAWAEELNAAIAGLERA